VTDFIQATTHASPNGIGGTADIAFDGIDGAAGVETARDLHRGWADRLFKYPIDRWPVAYAFAWFGAHLAVYFLATPWVAAACLLPLAIGSMFVAAINHHHQHLNMFRSSVLNRVYDLVLALQTGVGPYGWVLHHNLGHHVNYWNQPPNPQPDESKWTRTDGSQMGRVEYTVDLFLNHQLDMFRVGQKYPKHLRSFLAMKLPFYSLIALGLWFNPVNYLLAFLIPGVITLLHTIWATYEHHAGCPPSSHMDASRNRESRVFNWMTCNLGLHTAHHKRPGLHWSLLPELHTQIRPEIPPAQILKNFW